ncbi:MAG: acyl carrier protein [Methylococcales bacterium]
MMNNKQENLQSVIKILTEITSEWDTGFAGGISETTTLVNDLGFESIDIVYLLSAIEQHYGRRDFPFEDLLMEDGRHVDDLRVSQIVDFLTKQMQAGAVADGGGSGEQGLRHQTL